MASSWKEDIMSRKFKILGVPLFEIEGPAPIPVQEVQTNVPEPDVNPLDDINADALKEAREELTQAGQELRVERIKLRVMRVRADVADARQQQTTKSP